MNTAPQQIPDQKWYEQPVWIYLLVVFFFPVGLFLLWRKNQLSTKTKLIVTGLFLVLLTFALINDNGKAWKKIKKIMKVAIE